MYTNAVKISLGVEKEEDILRRNPNNSKIWFTNTYRRLLENTETVNKVYYSKKKRTVNALKNVI